MSALYLREVQAMILTPYQTTPCKGYNILKIVHEISTRQKIHYGDGTILAAFVDRQAQAVFYGQSNDERSACYVRLVTNGASDIPPFGHPIVVTHHLDLWNSFVPLSENNIHDPQPDGLDVYVDVRNFSKVTRENALVATNNLDMNFAVSRGIASLHWASNGPYGFSATGNFAMTVYARWISDQLTRRLALSAETQIKTTVIAAFFFGCQFIVGNTLNEDDKLKIAGQISRCIHTSVEAIMRIIEPLGMMNNINQFIAALKEFGESVRFEELNPALIYSILGGSWFGFNKSENIAVALEHVPTFMTLLYYATIERGYRNTILGQAAKNNAKADNDKQFCKSFLHILMN